MIRRLLNILGLVALLALLVVILINFSEPAWTWHTRWESKRLLAAAKTTNELTEAVGKLGCFLTFPDNSWMAIRYRDTHGGILASSAIVRDSGGTWFESTEHYCAAFRLGVVVHQKILEAEKELRDQGETNLPTYKLSGRELEISNLMTSTNLVAARINLEALGFGKIKAPASR